jgi:hypothetical protein
MKELLFLIVLASCVAVGFAGCGDDETDVPVVDAGVEVTASDAGGSDTTDSESETDSGSDAAKVADEPEVE